MMLRDLVPFICFILKEMVRPFPDRFNCKLWKSQKTTPHWWPALWSYSWEHDTSVTPYRNFLKFSIVLVLVSDIGEITKHRFCKNKMSLMPSGNVFKFSTIRLTWAQGWTKEILMAKVKIKGFALVKTAYPVHVWQKHIVSLVSNITWDVFVVVINSFMFHKCQSLHLSFLTCCEPPASSPSVFVTCRETAGPHCWKRLSVS